MPSRDPDLIPPDKANRSYGDDVSVPEWCWVDLPALRQAFLDAGCTELRHVDPDKPVVLMSHPDGVEALVPLAARGAWHGMVGTAVDTLERITGHPVVHLAALTRREAALWQLLDDTVAHLECFACTEPHDWPPDGPVPHPRRDDPTRPDLFQVGRCEMQGRIAARLYHLLRGADPTA